VNRENHKNITLTLDEVGLEPCFSRSWVTRFDAVV